MAISAITAMPPATLPAIMPTFAQSTFLPVGICGLTVGPPPPLLPPPLLPPPFSRPRPLPGYTGLRTSSWPAACRSFLSRCQGCLRPRLPRLSYWAALSPFTYSSMPSSMSLFTEITRTILSVVERILPSFIPPSKKTNVIFCSISVNTGVILTLPVTSVKLALDGVNTTV